MDIEDQLAEKISDDMAEYANRMEEIYAYRSATDVNGDPHIPNNPAKNAILNKDPYADRREKSQMIQREDGSWTIQFS
jgi:hypothetical protein